MKKGKLLTTCISVLLFATLLFSIMACSKTETTAPATTAATTAIASTTASTTAPPATVNVKPVEFVASSYMAANHPWNVALDTWFKNLEQSTNGKLKFKHYYDGTLVPQTSALEELKKGTVDICEVSYSAQQQYFPIEVAVETFFYGVKDRYIAANVYSQILKEFPEFDKEWGMAKRLADTQMGMMGVQSSKPIRSLADFKGKQVRILGAMLKYTMQQLGAVPVSIPRSEVYISMQKGIIDANMGFDDALQTQSMAEVAKYTTRLRFSDASGTKVMMNWDSYNELSPDLKKTIDDSLPGFQKLMTQSIVDSMQSGADYASSKYSHEWITLSDADYASMYQLLEFEGKQKAQALDAQGGPGSKILSRVQELIAQAQK